jgi:hypothetical protein
MRWAGYVARIGERRSVHRDLVGKPETDESLGRPKHRWEDNIKMNLHELGGRAFTELIWLRTGTDGGHM